LFSIIANDAIMSGIDLVQNGNFTAEPQRAKRSEFILFFVERTENKKVQQKA